MRNRHSWDCRQKEIGILIPLQVPKIWRIFKEKRIQNEKIKSDVMGSCFCYTIQQTMELRRHPGLYRNPIIHINHISHNQGQ
eukprot:scaffold2519_cov124-Cylindrotheca_fusiformis.AAC.6